MSLALLISPFLEYYYIEMLKDNITGTLGSKICAYWRAACNHCSDQSIADNTMILSINDDYVGEGLLENIEILIVAPNLFSYCEEYAENGKYQINFGE